MIVLEFICSMFDLDRRGNPGTVLFIFFFTYGPRFILFFPYRIFKFPLSNFIMFSLIKSQNNVI